MKIFELLAIFVLIVRNGIEAQPGNGASAMIAPMPPFPGTCVEDGATGFVNDACTADTDCLDSNAMTCSNKRCRCAPNFTPDPSLPTNSKRSCVPLPYLLSPCVDICQKPYECKSGLSPGAEFMGIPMSMGGKTCQCPGKSKYVNGFCDGGCKSNQRLGPSGRCVARCTKDQVLIDGECKNLVDVDAACTDNSQCKAAFTSCQNGKCVCASGFTVKDKKCVPKEYNCPIGEPLKKGDSVVLCEDSQSYPMPLIAMSARGGAAMGGDRPVAEGAPPPVPQVSSASMPFNGKPYKTDSCPNTHFCYNYDQNGMKSRGHCCPKPTAKCPVGERHPSGQCNGVGSQCPFQTHACLPAGAPGDYANQMICCPKPCQGYDKVFVKDQCLPVGQFGDGCEYNEQCQSINGVCQDGKCACGPKAKAVETGGPNKFCQLNCGPSEIAVGFECKQRLKLGDSCTGDNPFCPSGAYCNRKGVCACICGYEKMSDQFCAPQPYCPTNPFQAQSPQKNTAKNFTFCKLDGVEPPVKAAAKCPSKTFCIGYVENMGVCCPEPEPFCPDGSKPSSKRSCHNKEQACGPNEMCNIYFTAMTTTTSSSGMPQQGSVCCPMASVPMPVPMNAAAPGAVVSGQNMEVAPARSPRR